MSGTSATNYRRGQMQHIVMMPSCQAVSSASDGERVREFGIGLYRRGVNGRRSCALQAMHDELTGGLFKLSPVHTSAQPSNVTTKSKQATAGIVGSRSTSSDGGGGTGGVPRRQVASSIVRQSKDFRSLEGILAERRRYLKEMEDQVREHAGARFSLRSCSHLARSMLYDDSLCLCLDPVSCTGKYDQRRLHRLWVCIVTGMCNI